MITPVQQTPLPLDPIRQQITPTPPVAPPPPPSLAETPIRAADSSQDKFSPEDDGNRDEQRSNDLTEQQRNETVGKLRSAYLRLHELQREANTAYASGNATRAKELASEAAGVAQSIPASVGFLQPAVAVLSQGSEGISSVAATFDVAREGLSTAKDVVDTAASIPYHPVADRIAINGMRLQVLDAMAGVEDLAAKTAEAVAAASADTLTALNQHLDVKA
ncbi:hypothetical protein [Telmatospirillum siberiense]|uniref:Uncharacterized protein n=1 Tax=Telmatospirillum siberiense TaxID=382514 RepID=A0A2N3PMH9_9PROT|nr:hypothetical protein [Telmatospirillum siberiense]PKU21607.1 hypothetical protein CWS72_25975 [Telmatospirillum siberiense]